MVNFGLSNALPAFQQFINHVFRDINGMYIIVYIDDILVFSEDPGMHLQHVTTVLQRLIDNNLSANPAKCV